MDWTGLFLASLSRLKPGAVFRTEAAFLIQGNRGV